MTGDIIFVLLGIISETVIGTAFISIFGYQAMSTVGPGVNLLSVSMILLSYSMMFLLSWLYGLIRKRIDSIDLNNVLRIVRSVMIPAALLGLWFFILANDHGKSKAQHYMTVIPATLLVIAALAADVTYIIQDIRYVRQRRMNSALLEQKKLQEALLTDTRLFRHNIVNLLYGFQGTILSGDTESIRKYYEQMTETCRMINNENVISIERIPSMPVHALLLQKIQQAHQEKTPFYVYTDENLIWRGMKDPDLCEALGVLLDNALEAAEESAAPTVILEIHNAGSDMEVVVRNTCRDIESVFTQGRKKNHEGLGLSSLRKILKGYPNSILNLFTQGRFVEAHLLLR